MVDRNAEPDLKGLSTWQEALTRQAEDLRAEIRIKQGDLADIEESLSLVSKLIEVQTRAQQGLSGANSEAIAASRRTSSDEGAGPTTGNLEDAVEEILRAAGEPLHISAIREELVTKGVPIPGRGDDANIIVRLRRFQERFTRTARGTYGLAEWGIPALASKKHKRRRSATR